MTARILALFSLTIPAIVFATAGDAQALKTATATVACPGAKLQSAIDAAAAGVPTTITVTGTCSETIEVPQGKTIIINGNGATELKPPSSATNLPVVSNKGSLKLVKVKVTNVATTGNVVLSSGASELEIYASTIRGDNAEVTLEIAGASTGRIFNSIVSTNVGEGASAYSQATLEIFGRPSVTAHPTNGYTSAISSAGQGTGLGCGQGGNLVLRAEGTGKVTVKSTAGSAVSLELCDFLIRNKTSSAASIDLLGSGPAISSVLSHLLMQKATVKSTGQYALSLTQSDVRLSGLAFPKSGQGDIAADGSTKIKFNGSFGKTALPAAFNSGYQALDCDEDTMIFLSDDDVTLAAGKTAANLRQAYPSCFMTTGP